MEITSFIAGAITIGLSVWLTSLAAERKRKRERRENFLELVGRQQALVHRSKIQDVSETAVMEKYVDWLKMEKPTPATLALVIGYIEEGNKQIEPLIEKIETQHTTLADLERRVSKANEEHERLKTKLAELQSDGSKAGKTQSGEFKEP